MLHNWPKLLKNLFLLVWALVAGTWSPTWGQMTTVRVYGVLPAQSCTQGITVSYGPTAAYGSTVTATRSGGSFFVDVSMTAAADGYAHYAITGCGNPISGDSPVKIGTADSKVQAWTGKQTLYRAAVMKAPFGHATGIFHLEKVTFNGQTRWWLIDPTGNPFYWTGVQNATTTQLSANVITNKYGGSTTNWYAARNARMVYWGFYVLSEFISCQGLPVGCFGATSGTQPRTPFQNLQDGSTSSLNNPTASFCGVNEAVKNITTLQAAWYNQGGFALDVYDPKHLACVTRTTQYWESQYTTGMTSRKCSSANDLNCAARWMVGVTSDDGDAFSLYKGNGSGCVQQYPHMGFLVATSKFQAASGIDTTNYSKRAWINFLKGRYATIGALNTAWSTSSFYTNFEDVGGYGTGTGVIDEDGRHSWVGGDGTNGSNTASRTFAGVNATLQTDLNDFMYQMAKQYATNIVAAVKSVEQEHVLYSIDAINNYGEETRPKILSGLADGGFEAFHWNYDPGTVNPPGPPPCASPPRASMANNNASYDLVGKPAVIWYQVTASSDSADSGQPLVYGVPDHPPHSTAATFYTNDTTNFTGAAGTNSDRYVLGWNWWELLDHAGEGPGEGLVSDLDNAYNGAESVIASVTCSPPLDGVTQIDGLTFGPYTCGGEAGNWGNFIGTIRATNTGIYQTLLGAPQP